MEWIPLIVGAVLILAAVATAVYLNRIVREAEVAETVMAVLDPERAPLHGVKLERLRNLQDALVDAGWRHKDWVDDPVHHDEAGRYLYWGD